MRNQSENGEGVVGKCCSVILITRQGMNLCKLQLPIPRFLDFLRTITILNNCIVFIISNFVLFQTMSCGFWFGKYNHHA